MNQMARESIWYISCLVLQLLWNRKWNEQRVLEEEPVIDPIIEPQTWMNFIWNIVNRNAGITAFSAMFLGRWTLIAIWRLIKQRLMNIDGRVVATPTMFHEGMNVNKWLREFSSITMINRRHQRLFCRHIIKGCAVGKHQRNHLRILKTL